MDVFENIENQQTEAKAADKKDGGFRVCMSVLGRTICGTKPAPSEDAEEHCVIDSCSGQIMHIQVPRP